jgi:serpin B
MGLGSIFVHANVARMVPSRTPMKVGKVVQKTWIQVDESGTKAAAATTIQIRPTAIFGGHRQVIQFHVDRPFAFTIEDRKSGAILFAGVVRRVP